ncbi:MBL fold metallo-hydrolase [Candidatus Kaiserbacteria bacterium]|nr:MBL fold metallo-hydrolase [Candidatus Kaiserbacteria bacterium]
MAAKITFYGGAGTVTGANFLVDTNSTGSPQAGTKILVDCGILQRETVCDVANSASFSYDVGAVDALIVTHAHADHIGRIPRLVRDGFHGTIHSTGATKELAALMFTDALSIMQDEALKHGCEVLYEAGDVEKALSLWGTHEYHEPFPLKEASIEFLDAGHILGSVIVKMTHGGRTLVFSGDLGNSPEPLLNETEFPVGANYIVMESVYGDRVHEGREARREQLRQCVEKVRARKGVLLIPSFSLERTQLLLFELNVMMEEGKLAPIPVYLDSPLAIEVTEVFRKYKRLLNPTAQKHFSGNNDPFSFQSLKLTREVSESRAIHVAPSPKIIIAGAGMSHGGRIRAHEKYYLGDKHAVILFVGYQVPGSLGRRIQDGEKRVEIDGEHIRIYAERETLSGYSGHADREQLLTFVENSGEEVERVFVTMGEPRSSSFLAQRIKDFLGVDAVVPEAGQSFEIDW